MLNPLRTPVVFLALTLMLAGWLHAWTIPRHSMWWGRGVSHPDWYKLRQHRPLYRLACTLTGANGSGRTGWTPGDVHVTGPVVIETTTDVRIVPAEALGVIIESETVLAAGYERTDVYCDEFGLLATSAIRKRSIPTVMSVAGLKLLDLETLHAVLYPELIPFGGVKPRTRWYFSWRAIIHDGFTLLALVIWTYSVTGIPRWSIWKRDASEPPA